MAKIDETKAHLVSTSLDLAEANDCMARVAADERRFGAAADHTRAALRILHAHYSESDPEIGYGPQPQTNNLPTTTHCP